MARANKVVAYNPEEQDELIGIFAAMLMQPTKDGGNKRAKGQKPSWKVDPDHVRAIFSHLGKWVNGHTIDEDSGAHALIHCAWRCLAVAWQEEQQLKWLAEQEKLDVAIAMEDLDC